LIFLMDVQLIAYHTNYSLTKGLIFP